MIRFLLKTPHKLLNISAKKALSIYIYPKEVFHFNYFGSISERPTIKSFHKPIIKSVRIDVIGLFAGIGQRIISHNLNR